MAVKQVTVGVPAYKAESTLRLAVESLLEQTYPVHRIHISDDASPDGTEQVGMALAAEHASVAYTRQSVNVGRVANFGALLHAADTDYFMWLAGDDRIDPTYVEKMIAVLEADRSLVACVSRVMFVDAKGGTSLATGSAPLTGDVATNLATYLSGPGANARFYALYRTKPLQQSFPTRSFHAWDWAVSAGTLLHGGHAEVPETLMVRDETPVADYIRSIDRDNAGIPLARVFPVWPMTMDLIWRQRIPLTWPILRALINLNLRFHCDYASMYHPHYATRVVPFLRKHLVW